MARTDFDAVVELVAEGALTAHDLLDADVLTYDEYRGIEETVEAVRYAASQGYGERAYALVLDEKWPALKRLVSELRRLEGLSVDPDGGTLDEVGKAIGVCRERIRQIEEKALDAVSKRGRLAAFADPDDVREFASNVEPRILPAGRYGTDPLLAAPLRISPAARTLQIRNSFQNTTRAY